MRYCFVGKNFVVRLSTTKTTKILPPEKYPYSTAGVAMAVPWCANLCTDNSIPTGMNTLLPVMAPSEQQPEICPDSRWSYS